MGPPFYMVIWATGPSFLSYFKTPEYWSGPWNRTCDLPLYSQALDWLSLVLLRLKNLKILPRKSLNNVKKQWLWWCIHYVPLKENGHLCHMFVKFLEIFLMWLCLHFSVSDKPVSESKPAVENKGNATVLYFLCGFIVLYTPLKLIMSMKSLISRVWSF